MPRRKDPFAAERKALYADDRRQMEQWNKQPQTNTTQNQFFKNRPSNNPLINGLKDVVDFGRGISTVASMTPSVIDHYIKLYGKSLATPEGVKGVINSLLNVSPKVAKEIVKGYAENYGQEKGLNASNFLKSFVKHPLNILDVAPALGVANKVLKNTSSLSKTVAGLGEAGKAFDAMGEIPRIKGNLKIKNPEVLSNVNKITKDVTSSADNFIKFATKSGANQHGKGFAGAGEIKNIKTLTPGQQHTFAHIYGNQLKGLDPTQQTDIINLVKNKFGVESLKDVPDEQLADVVQSVRKNLPTQPQSTGNFKRIVQNARVAEPEINPLRGGIEKTLGKGKQLFTAGVLSNPGWLIGNAVGDVYHTLTGGENLVNVIKNGLDPRYAKLVSKTDLGGFYKDTQKFRDAVAKLKEESPILSKMTSFADPFFKAEGAREGVFRQGVFANQLNDLAKNSLVSQGIKPNSQNIFDEASKLARTQSGYDEAIKGSKQILGDYRSFKPFEKQLGAVVPFYKWYREASKIAAHQPIRQPLIYGGLKGASVFGNDVENQQNQAVQDLGYEIPEYNRGGFVTGVDSTGRPEIFNAGKILPITTVSNLAESALKFPQGIQNYLSPIISTPMQVMSGTNFTGRPATSPNVFEDFNGRRYHVNPENDVVTPLQEGQLPEGEAMRYMISSMLRGFTPAGTIERYMPQRTFDTRIFEVDKTRPEKAGNSLIRNLGLGTYSRAYKQPNIDTERILERAKKRLNP